jgi:hypothetical protein
MPEGRFARVVILAEDRVQSRFIYRWILTRIKHLEPRLIRVVPAPPGRGAGEQFVRTKFGQEANAHRKMLANHGSMLIAVIDADTVEFIDRYRELMDQSLEKRNVFVFVPKRNIETWLHQLNGNSPNETDDFKPVYARDPRPAIDTAVKRFVEYTVSPSTPTDGLVPSLAYGVKTGRDVPKSHKPLPR